MFSYEEAKTIVSPFKIISAKNWREFTKTEGFKTIKISVNPDRTYKDKGWVSWGDFLSTGNVRTKDFVSFEEAKKIVGPFNLKSQREWIDFTKTDDFKKLNLPVSPESVYKNDGWISLGDFLGTNFIATKNKKYPTYEDAKIIVHSLNIKSGNAWRDFTKTQKFKTLNLPVGPELAYSSKGWVSWGDFLGTGIIAVSKLVFKSYEEAKVDVHRLNLKSQKEWYDFTKTEDFKSLKLPATPSVVYKDDDFSWGNFLGTGTIAPQNKTFLSYDEAKKIIQPYGLKSNLEWRDFTKTEEFKSLSLPVNADQKYKDDDFSWGDFLGTGNLHKKEFLSYIEAKKIVHNLKLQSHQEWFDYIKNNLIDQKIPRDPYKQYKNNGFSWSDFLGYKPAHYSKPALISFLKDIEEREMKNLDSFSIMVLMQYLNIPIQKLLNFKGEDRKLGDLILGITNKKADDTEDAIQIDDIVHAIENIDEDVIQEDELLEENNEDILNHQANYNEDEQDELKFLSSNELRILEGLIEEVMADDYAVFSLINNYLGKIWREFFVHQDIDLIKSKNNDGEFNSVVLNKFFEEYNLTLNHKTPEHFNTSCGITPNIMQIFTCCKLSHQKRLFNFSGTGSGKTLSSIYSAIHNDNKFVVIITENNVTKQWEKEILKFDLNANILDKKLLINIDKRNYLVINFEQFQLPRTRKLIDNLIELAPDFIILDEIQNVKVRGSENSIRRTNIEYFLTTLSNNNPDLFLLAMSATPCVNNLNEIKSLLELGLNESLEKIKTSLTVMNAFYLHSYIVNYGIRYMPKYPILADYKYPDIDVSDSHDIIVNAHKEKNPLYKEQILLGFKLPSIMSFLKPGTIIYTEYVDGIALEARNYIEANSDFKVGLYTGNQSEEEKAETLSKFKRCHGKTKNKYDILIGSSTIGTGVDGLQEVCDNLIYLTLPWTSATKQQVDGRVIRQNSKFKKVQIITPQVVYHAIVDEEEKTWSYDYYRQNIINNKKTLMDCVMDGVNPSHLDPSSKQQDLIKAHQGLNKWIEHLLENDMTIHSQTELKITNITLVNEQPIKLKSDFAKLNTSWKKKHSSNLHEELNKNNEEWQEYHSLYAEKRLQWAEIPVEVIAKKLISRQEWKIADLGCGECLLRNNLPNHKITEYDHVSFDEKVISCDISNLPVENNTFDAAVLSLALMGANWSDYIKESYRILKDFGLLIIAENERSWENFENNEIIDCLQEYGFNIKSKEISQGFIYIQAIK
jgi:superfamily II DNA or RNA helicase